MTTEPMDRAAELPRALRTPRLALEATSSAHAEGLWAAVERSMAELLPWMAWAEGDDLAHTMAFCSMTESMWEQGSGWTFTIMHGGSEAGTIGLGNHDGLIARAEIGYWLRSDLCGRGLMTEAASAVVSFGFERAGLHRIELHAAPANIGSVRIAEKLGFQREGMLRHGTRSAGGWQDVICFGLLETDPRPGFHLPI